MQDQHAVPVERRNDDLDQLLCCAGGVRCRRQADDWEEVAPSGVRCWQPPGVSSRDWRRRRAVPP